MKKREKGTITLMVLVVCLLMLSIIMIITMNISNKSQEQNKKIETIVNNYSESDAKLEEVYNETVSSSGYATLNDVNDMINKKMKSIYPVR